MYNKKCLSTFMFCLALISLITLILPFVNVNFFGETTILLKILYFISIVIFSVCVVLISAIGIFNLFKNEFTLVSIQEFLGFIAFFMLLIPAIVFLPTNANLTVGYSILLLESFVLACFNALLKLIRKLPRTVNTMVENIKAKKAQKQKIEEEKHKLEEESKEIVSQQSLEDSNNSNDFDEVKIIPPNENDLI